MKNEILDDNCFDKYRTQARNRCSEMAKDAREKITQEYLQVVRNFYSEYQPIYYRRHGAGADLKLPGDIMNNIVKSGMGRTFTKYYHDNHGKYFTGGIRINTDKMFTDYEYGAENTLESFLDGWHGPTWGYGLWSSAVPWKHMTQYAELLTTYYKNEYKCKS